MGVLGRMLCQYLLFLVWSVCVRTYNVDLPSAVVHRGPSDSLFGFSVASHKDRGQSWVLVGAPEASTQQPDLEKPGAVFRCSTESPDQCQIVPFDRTGNNNEAGRQIDNKSRQWFGATVRSSGPNGVVMACAPRYVWYSTNFARREPVGTCFVARDSFREFSEYSPCRTASWGYHRQGSCQAGLGAALAPDGQRLFIGAVGSWYWQGQQYSINITNPRVRSEIFREFVTGEIFSQNLYSRADVFATKEGPPTDDDSYLGYSVAVGEFNGDNVTDVAVGMPRGANLTGKILLFTSNMTNLHNISGQQLGSYFGYSLAVSDVNGDGRDDILVGAPLYTNFDNTEGKYETGRVYVIYQTARHTFRNWHILDGETSRSRFGLSLAGAGDINRDGFGDFIVGSPYDGINGKGAVYIYHGSEAGVKTKASQVIYAEDIQISLNTFGFSVSGSVDIDDNEYPDISVGAYDSNAAVVLRTRPVIYMNSVNLSFETESKQIDLEARSCSLLDGTLVACVPLKLCLEYVGIGVEKTAEFDVQFTLDSKKAKTPRLYFLADEAKSSLNHTVTLTKGSQYCKSFYVYVKPKIRDKLTPIEAEVRFSIKNSTSIQSTSTRTRSRRSLTPVLHAEPSSGRDQLNIQKNCGSDNICYPNMRVLIKSNVQNYVMGSGERVEVDVTVINSGEDAFEAMFHMIIPQGISYVNVDRSGTDNSGDAAILCSPPSPDSKGGGTLRCDIGNPLPGQKTVNFRVLLQPLASVASKSSAITDEVSEEQLKSSFDFYIEVNSTNAELEGNNIDNVVLLSMPIRVETDIIIRGISNPETLSYNKSAYVLEGQEHENQIGPEVIHLYDLGNRGPSDILAADVYILWPSRTLAGKDLLYLLEEPIVEGAGRCQPVDDVNTLSLVLDGQTKSSKTGTGSGKVHTSSSSHQSSSTRVIGGQTVTSSSSSSASSSHSGSSVSDGETAVSRKATVTYSSSSNRTGDFDDSSSNGYPSRTRTGASGAGSVPDNGRRSGGNVVVKEVRTSSRYTGNSQSQNNDKTQSGTIRGSTENYDQDEYDEGSDEQESVIHASSSRGTVSGARSGSQQGAVIRTSNSRATGTGISSGSHEEIQTSRQSSPQEGTGQRTASGRIVHGQGGKENLASETFASRTSSSEEVIEESGDIESAGSQGFATSSRGTSGGRHQQQSGSSSQSSTTRRVSQRQGQNVDRSHSDFDRLVQSPGVGSRSHSSTLSRTINGSRTQSQDSDADVDDLVTGIRKDVYTSFGTGVGENAARNSSSSSAQGTQQGQNVGGGSRAIVVKKETYTSRKYTSKNSEPWEEETNVTTITHDAGKSTKKTQVSKSKTLSPKFIKGQSGQKINPDFVEEFRESDDENGPGVPIDTRVTRSVDEKEDVLKNELSCGATQCTVIKCEVGPLAKNDHVLFRIRSRVWVQTLAEMGYEDVQISSKLVARVKALPYGVDPSYMAVRTEQVSTILDPTDRELEAKPISWWVIVLAALAGVLLLLLLVFLLWKLGFFKRKRPDGAEKEPLQSGDEAL